MPRELGPGQKLRVLLITPDYPPAHGGIQRLMHRATSSLPNSETAVLTLRDPGWRDFDRDNPQPARRFPRWPGPAAASRVGLNIQALMGYPGFTPDVVLSGHVVTGPVTLAVAHRVGARAVCYTHGKEVVARKRLTGFVIRNSDAGVAVSEYTKARVAEATGPSSVPVHVIHPGVDVPPHAGGADAELPTILTVSRLRDWYKGHDVVMQAMPAVRRAVPNVRWVVIGDGRRSEDLKRMAHQLDVADAVIFLGSVDDAERDRWLASSNVFAMLSRYPEGEIGGEGFPLVYLEAAAWGLPVVAGDFGAAGEAVVDGETGLLADPTSPDAVANALVALLTDPDRARAYGARGRARAQNEFTFGHIGAQLEAMLRGSVASPLPV